MCRCKERRDAIVQAAKAGTKSEIKQAASFVTRTLVEDIRRPFIRERNNAKVR